MRRGRATDRRRLGLVLSLGMVAAIGVGYVFGPHGPLHHQQAARPYTTESHPAGVYATTTASADPAGPFADTPAAHWAEGADGITLPDATAVTGFSRTTVASDLVLVKQALIATRLDNAMLVRHDPTVFLQLVAAGERPQLQQEFAEPLSFATLLDDGTHLDSHQPRVSGRTSFSSIVDYGGIRVVEVVTNYVWAYAFDNGEVTIVHDEHDWRFYRASDVRAADAGMWMFGSRGYLSGMDCSAMYRGRLAPFRPMSGSGPASPDPENPDNYYDPNHSLDVGDGCPVGSPTPAPTPSPQFSGLNA
jgi:hypothetical protein